MNAGFVGLLSSVVIGYSALLAIMLAKGIILNLNVAAECWLNAEVTMLLSRITAIILADLLVRYVIDGMSIIGLITPWRLTFSHQTL